MKDKRLTQEQKVMIAVFVAILVLLCIGGYIIINNRAHQQSAAALQNLTASTRENSPASSAKIFLPVIAFELSTEQVKPNSILEAQPTKTPTKTPSNLWKVTKIYAQSYSLRGYVYDLGVFENVSTGENIKAFCANPGWPAPNLGDLFVRNAWNVLVATNNAKPPWTQHFIVIDH